MALDFLTADEYKNKQRPKVVVTENDRKQAVLTVARTNQRGQLMQAIANAGHTTSKNTPAGLKLTGLTKQEESQRRSKAAQQSFEQEVEKNKQAYSGMNLLGKLVKELPRNGAKIIAENFKGIMRPIGEAQAGLTGARDFVTGMPREISRDIAAFSLSAAQGINDVVGGNENNKNIFREQPVTTPVARFIFGSEPIKDLYGRGDEIRQTVDEAQGKGHAPGSALNAPIGFMLFASNLFMGGKGKTVFKAGERLTKFAPKFIHLADDILGSADELKAVSKSVDELSTGTKTVATSVTDDVVKTVEKVIAPKPAQTAPLSQRSANAAKVLESAKKDGQAVERVTQNKLRLEDPEAYFKAEVETRLKEITGSDITRIDVPYKLPKEPNKWQRTWTSSSGVMSQYGKAGSEIASRDFLVFKTSYRLAGRMTSQMPKFKGLNKKETVVFVDALENLRRGKDPGKLSSKILETIDEWKKTWPQPLEWARNVGMDPGDLGPYHFPKDYSKVFSDKKKYAMAVNHLVDTGQAKNVPDALQIMRRGKKSMSRKFGNLEFSRKYDLPFYEKTQKAVSDYIGGMADRVAHVQYFGPEDEVAMELIATAGSKGYDMDKMIDIYMTMNGIQRGAGTVAAQVSGALRYVQGVTSLNSAAVANAGQPINSATVMGAWRQLGGMAKFFTDKNAVREIERMGIVTDQALSALAAGHGFDSATGLVKKIGAPLFSEIERFNRISTAIAGKNWVEDLAKETLKGGKRGEKAMRILTQKLRVSGVIKNGKLTDEQLGESLIGLVDITQFHVGSRDLMDWVNSPYGKLAAQFRTFPYKQGGFMYNEVIKEAAQGNVLPAVRFLSIGIPVGLAVGAVRDVAKGREVAIDSNPLIEGFGNVGGFGLGGDVMFLWDTRKSGNFVQYGSGVVGGPSAGMTVQTINNIGKAARGDTVSIRRQGLKAIPGVGPLIQNKVLPYNLSRSGSSSGSRGKSDRI